VLEVVVALQAVAQEAVQSDVGDLGGDAAHHEILNTVSIQDLNQQRNIGRRLAL
jgi:hypothetical protein